MPPNPLPHHISRPLLVFYKGFANILAQDAQHNQLYTADKQHTGGGGGPAGNGLLGKGVNVKQLIIHCLMIWQHTIETKKPPLQ